MIVIRHFTGAEPAKWIALIALSEKALTSAQHEACRAGARGEERLDGNFAVEWRRRRAGRRGPEIRSADRSFFGRGGSPAAQDRRSDATGPALDRCCDAARLAGPHGACNGRYILRPCTQEVESAALPPTATACEPTPSLRGRRCRRESPIRRATASAWSAADAAAASSVCRRPRAWKESSWNRHSSHRSSEQ